MFSRCASVLSTATLILCVPGVSSAAAPCATRPVEPNSQAEIRNLERQWSGAYWTGHTDFLECLYASDFVSISSDGSAHDRKHDIDGSIRYVGKSYTPHGGVRTDVLMHQNFAIATSIKVHAAHGLRVTDIYAYDGRHWHAIFSQDTKY